ncbi:MAG: hypothetical protein JJE40_17305 [Vicinamibacteria bacterium]|nr:hypothetical protein [Vicinamibacteria bacterium]
MTVNQAGRRMLVAAALVAGCALGASAQTTLSLEEKAQFLRTARITSSKDIPKGVTRPIRLTLTDGTLTHDAAFSAVDEHTAILKFKDGRTELDFVDSYKYTLAAYQLAAMLGIDDMMPVTVEREVDHHKGSLAWWVDDVKWDEGERLKLKLQPPDPEAWNRQMYRMRLFAQLIADTDRNTGNMLITSDWKLWMIDFTRAFRRSRKLLVPGEVARCDRALLDRLRALTKDEVAAKTKPFIGGAEIAALMARRDAILVLVDKLVADNGEAKVLY